MRKKNRKAALSRSAFKDKVRALCAPQTPEEWAIALNCPESLIYKFAMALQKEAMYECMLEELLTILVMEDNKKTKENDREALFTNMLAAKIMSEREYETALKKEEQKLAQRLQELNALSYQQHQERSIYLTKEIKQATQEKVVLLKEMESLSKKIPTLNADIEKRQNNYNKEFQEAINSKKLVIQVREGNEKKELNFDQVNKILEAIPKPPPMDIVLRRAYSEGGKLKLPKADTSKARAINKGVHNQILQIAALNGNNASGKSMLQFLRDNKAANHLMGELSKKNHEADAKDIGMMLEVLDEYQNKAYALEDKTQSIAQMEDNLKTSLAFLEKVDVKQKP